MRRTLYVRVIVQCVENKIDLKIPGTFSFFLIISHRRAGVPNPSGKRTGILEEHDSRDKNTTNVTQTYISHAMES